MNAVALIVVLLGGFTVTLGVLEVVYPVGLVHFVEHFWLTLKGFYVAIGLRLSFKILVRYWR